MFNKKKLVSNKTTSRSFSYQKGNVGLSFSLRIDIDEELNDFIDCLEKALDEVKKEITSRG